MAELQPMYKGIPFSPFHTLSADIGAEDTVIPLSSTVSLPDAPNYATIGVDENAETILYTTKTDTELSGCVRAIEGTAKAWTAGEIVARNWTNADYETLISNLALLHSHLPFTAGVTLTADKWEAVDGGFEQSITVDGVTAEHTVDIVNVDKAVQDFLNEQGASFLKIGNNSGTLTAVLTCDDTEAITDDVTLSLRLFISR